MRTLQRLGAPSRSDYTKRGIYRNTRKVKFCQSKVAVVPPSLCGQCLSSAAWTAAFGKCAISNGISRCSPFANRPPKGFPFAATLRCLPLRFSALFGVTSCICYGSATLADILLQDAPLVVYIRSLYRPTGATQ